MKKISFFLVLFLGCTLIAQAQFRGGIGYQNSRPLGSMAMNINNIHQFKLEGLGKVWHTRLWLGGEIGLGGYASRREPIMFEQNGTITNTYINVSNNVTNFGLMAQLDLLKRFNVAMPYLHAAVNTNIYATKLVIEDPEDEDGCEPLDSEVLRRDYAASASLGVGVRLALFNQDSRFCDYITMGRTMLDLRAFYTLGTRVSYMNANEMNNHNHSQHEPRANTESIDIQFRNRQTNDIHAHRVGTVFNDPLSHLGIQATISVSLGE
ncbi:MAG: hypothetical protein EAZ57_02645 [Cytophagales bacterium]|nr:MAG: hypothetical protein EAZ67_03110 [Cytophagales bacterium]TAF61662.1 MAG: hypothetical protein EAZ57_02645 [Cytophagales bacterium]